MIKSIGSCVIGALYGFIGISVYNFKTNEFNLFNTFVLVVSCVVWIIICDIIEKNKE